MRFSDYMIDYHAGVDAYDDNEPFRKNESKAWQDGYIDRKAAFEGKTLEAVERELGLH